MNRPLAEAAATVTAAAPRRHIDVDMGYMGSRTSTSGVAAASGNNHHHAKEFEEEGETDSGTFIHADVESFLLGLPRVVQLGMAIDAKRLGQEGTSKNKNSDGDDDPGLKDNHVGSTRTDKERLVAGILLEELQIRQQQSHNHMSPVVDDGNTGVNVFAEEWARATSKWQKAQNNQCNKAHEEDIQNREKQWREAEATRLRHEEKLHSLAADIDKWKSQEEKAAATAAVTTPRRTAGGLTPRGIDPAATSSSSSTNRTTASSAKDQGSSSSSTTHATSAAMKADVFTGKKKFVTLLALEEGPEITSRMLPNLISDFETANTLFMEKRDYEGALRLYSDVIDRCPPNWLKAAFFTNRAACWMNMSVPSRALRDAQKGMEMDGTSVLAKARAARCYLLLMNLRAARNLFAVLQSKHSDAYDLTEDLEACAALEQYRDCMSSRCREAAFLHVAAACSIIPSLSLELLRVECLADLRPSDALEDAIQLCESFPKSPDVWYWAGILRMKCCTWSAATNTREASDGHATSGGFSFLDSAQKDLMRCISVSTSTNDAIASSSKLSRSSSGDEKKMKDDDFTAENNDELKDRCTKLLQTMRQIDTRMNTANSYFATKRWKQAATECSLVMALDLEGSHNSRVRLFLLLRRAQCQEKMENFLHSVADCNAALSHGEAMVVEGKILLARSRARIGLGQFDKAEQDMDKARKIRGGSGKPSQAEIEEVVEFLTAERKKKTSSQQSNNNRRRSSSSIPPSTRNKSDADTYYRLLGVEQNATKAAISRAYKMCALKWHPDKWEGTASTAEKKMAEERFKAMNHAYSILSNADSRATYDKTI